MAAKKQVLGRGLGALLQSMETTNPEVEYNNSITASIAFIPISKIEPNPNQPRKDRPKHISHSLSIIGDPRHDGAGRRFVKISHPQLLDVGKGFLPHIADDAVCHSGESIASQIGKEDPQQEEQVIAK